MWRSGAEFGRLIAIGRNVRIGGGAIILPGVTIDDDATIRGGGDDRSRESGACAGLSPIPRLIEVFGPYICLGLAANSPFEPLCEVVVQQIPCPVEFTYFQFEFVFRLKGLPNRQIWSMARDQANQRSRVLD